MDLRAINRVLSKGNYVNLNGKEEIETFVKKYINDNPELLSEIIISQRREKIMKIKSK